MLVFGPYWTRRGTTRLPKRLETWGRTWRLWPTLRNCPEIRNCSFLVPIGHAGVPQDPSKGLKHGEGPGACGQTFKIARHKELLVLCPYWTRRGTPRPLKRLETWGRTWRLWPTLQNCPPYWTRRGTPRLPKRLETWGRTWRLWPSLQNCPEIRNCSFLVPIGHAGVRQGSPKGLNHGERPGACGQAAKLP